MAIQIDIEIIAAQLIFARFTILNISRVPMLSFTIVDNNYS